MAKRLSTQDRVLLLLAVIPYLQEHGPTPVAELAAAFEVDEALMRRLIRFLGTAGVPGETLSYQHEDLFDIDWDALEQADIVSLTQVVAVDDAPRFSSTETATLIAGLHAITPALPEHLRSAAHSAARKLAAAVEQLDTTELSAAEEAVPAAVQLLASVIGDGRCVDFHYVSVTGEHSTRTVLPQLLSKRDLAWYLQGYCLDRNDARTFMVDRMSEIAVSTRTAPSVIGGALPPEALSKLTTEVTASLRVRESALHRMADFMPRLKGDAGTGWLRVEVDLTHPGAAVRLVQIAPGEVVIEHPEAARDAVRAWAELGLAGEAP